MAGRNILYFAALTIGLVFGIKGIVAAALGGVAAPPIAWGAVWAANKVWITITAITIAVLAFIAKEGWMISTIKRQGKQINVLQALLAVAAAAEEPLDGRGGWGDIGGWGDGGFDEREGEGDWRGGE